MISQRFPYSSLISPLKNSFKFSFNMTLTFLLLVAFHVWVFLFQVPFCIQIANWLLFEAWKWFKYIIFNIDFECTFAFWNCFLFYFQHFISCCLSIEFKRDTMGKQKRGRERERRVEKEKKKDNIENRL